MAISIQFEVPTCSCDIPEPLYYQVVLLSELYNLSGLSLPVLICILLAACERLILLQTDPKELRDYGALLYHCGFYKEALQYLTVYQDRQVVFLCLVTLALLHIHFIID